MVAGRRCVLTGADEAPTEGGASLVPSRQCAAERAEGRCGM